MRTREEQIKPWGYISPFAKKSLQDFARCDLTITRKPTVSSTMALYTEESILEAERRAEQRVREEMGKDSERLDWLWREVEIYIYPEIKQSFIKKIGKNIPFNQSFREIIDLVMVEEK